MGYFDSIYASSLSHRARTVYMYLKDRCGGQSRCWPAIRTIAEGLGISRSTVKRALGELERTGYIEKESRRRENGGLTRVDHLRGRANSERKQIQLFATVDNIPNSVSTSN